MSPHYNPSSNNFNFIRFIAALFVIISHTFDIPNEGKNEPLRQLCQTDFSFSYIGLSAFFLLSGFLITQSWAQRKSASQFLLNRLLRIIPGLFVVVLLTIFIYGPLFTQLPINIYFSQIDTFAYLKNVLIFQSQGHLPGVFTEQFRGPLNGSIWTLPYEALFYLCTPILSAAIHRAGTRSLFVIPVIIMLSYWMISHPDIGNMYSPKLNIYRGAVVTFGGFFVAGSLFYTYHQQIPFDKTVFWTVTISYVALIATVDIAIVKALSPFLIGYILFYLAFQKSPVSDFGKNYDLSYGMYIYAFPIQLVILYHLQIQSAWISILVTLILVLPLAWFSWTFVEKPMLKLRKRPTIQRVHRQAEPYAAA